MWILSTKTKKIAATAAAGNKTIDIANNRKKYKIQLSELFIRIRYYLLAFKELGFWNKILLVVEALSSKSYAMRWWWKPFLSFLVGGGKGLAIFFFQITRNPTQLHPIQQTTLQFFQKKKREKETQRTAMTTTHITRSGN
jgi:hypothetical protein